MLDTAILVVDDDADHRELIVDALAQRCERGRIGTAGGGAEALDWLLGRGAHAGRDTRKQPRLVVLDLRMQPLDGLDVLGSLRSEAATVAIPVVVLSASSDKHELDSCYEAGANSVVRKSSDWGELSRKMAHVAEFWLTVNETNRASRV